VWPKHNPCFLTLLEGKIIMYRKMSLIVVAVSIVLLSTMSMAAPVDITQPGDAIQGFPNDGVTTGGNDNGWPAN